MSPRKQTAEDAERAIRRTVDDYAYAIDRRDDLLYATLWAPDATFRIFEHGRLVLTRTLAETLGTPGRMRRFVATMHAVVAHRSSVDDDRATASTDCRASHIVALASGGHVCYEVGLRYDDVLVPGPQARWVFASRDLQLLWGTAAPAVVEGIFDPVATPRLLDGPWPADQAPRPATLSPPPDRRRR